MVDKLKILKNPSKKSARELLKDLASKKGYNCFIEQRDVVIISIDKKNVPMSLTD